MLRSVAHPILFLVLVGILLSGCGTRPPDSEARVTLTVTPLTTLEAVLSPVAQAEPSSTVVPTPRPTLGILRCERPSETATLPDLAPLQWEMINVKGTTAQLLNGVPYPVYPLEASPDGRWLAVGVEMRGSSYGSAIAIIDTQGKEYWWANRNTFVYYDIPIPDMQWLTDGRLLWVDEANRVRLGIGEAAATLDAPVPIAAVYLAASPFAFAVGTQQDNIFSLWRVNLDTDTWEEVSLPQGEHWQGTIAVARDGTYAIARTGIADNGSSTIYDALMWRIPGTMGTEAEILPSFPVNLSIGRGGPLPPDAQLGNGPYWIMEVFSTLIEDPDKGYIASNVLVDIRDGHVVTAQELGPEGAEYLTTYTISPDGKWFAVYVSTGDAPTKGMGLYIAPTDDIKEGQLLPLEQFYGYYWHPTQPSLALYDNVTGDFFSIVLPLSSGSVLSPLVNSQEPLIPARDGYLTGYPLHHGQLLSFALDGAPRPPLDFSLVVDFVTDGYSHGYTDGTRTWLTTITTTERNNCLYGLIQLSD